LEFLNHSIQDIASIPAVVTKITNRLRGLRGVRAVKNLLGLLSSVWRGLYRKCRMFLGSAGRGVNKVGGFSKVRIWSPPHTLFLANQLVESLNEMGIKSRIVGKPVVCLSRADLDIILAPAYFSYPVTNGPRIVFQLEQTTSSRWFTSEYINYMNGSLAVFEYSKFNVGRLARLGVDSAKIYFVPLGGSTKIFRQSILLRSRVLTRDKKIMAYGFFTGSPRRERFIEYAIEKMPALIVNSEVFGEEMAKELESSDVVVHINYYTPAILATPRLWESLSRGCQVVSEKAMNWREDPFLVELVDFVNEDQFDLVRERANELNLVGSEALHRLTTIEGSELRFKGMLARALFGAGAIDELTFTQHEKTDRD